MRALLAIAGGVVELVQKAVRPREQDVHPHPRLGEPPDALQHRSVGHGVVLDQPDLLVGQVEKPAEHLPGHRLAVLVDQPGAGVAVSGPLPHLKIADAQLVHGIGVPFPDEGLHQLAAGGGGAELDHGVGVAGLLGGGQGRGPDVLAPEHDLLAVDDPELAMVPVDEQGQAGQAAAAHGVELGDRDAHAHQEGDARPARHEAGGGVGEQVHAHALRHPRVEKLEDIPAFLVFVDQKGVDQDVVAGIPDQFLRPAQEGVAGEIEAQFRQVGAPRSREVQLLLVRGKARRRCARGARDGRAGQQGQDPCQEKRPAGRAHTTQAHGPLYRLYPKFTTSHRPATLPE